MERERAVELIRPRLDRESDLVAAWLFGSVARGEERAGSDVDLAILRPTPSSLDTLLGLQADLTGLLGVEVQVVDVRSAPVDLVHRVLRDGVLLVDRARGARIAFEVDARNRYFDMRPILLEYRRARART